MIWYTAISGFIFLWMSFIWSKKDWVNFSLKFGFFVLAMFAGFLTLESLGYLVKVA